MTAAFFRKNKIVNNYDLIAHDLKTARTQKEISLTDAARVTKIKIEYLQWLESGEMEKLPVGVYRKNYLRQYASFLGLKAEEIVKQLADYQLDSNHQQLLFSRQAPKISYPFGLHRLFIRLLIFSIVTICLVYLGFYIKNIVAPPELAITSPLENLITADNALTVTGRTEPEAQVTINGEKVLLDASGLFSKKINLASGVNNILITAQKKYSRINQIYRTVLLKN
jgi:cytoskeletal protein RodZ